MFNLLSKGIKSACRPGDRRPPWQWCEDHVVVDSTSSKPGPWHSSYSPWVKELMEVFADNQVTDISVRCPAQTAKTQTVLALCCWAISENPGPFMYVLSAADEAKDFVRDRVAPTFRMCDPVASKLISDSKDDFEFDGFPFYFVGANSKSKLQGKPIRYLIMDEARNYPDWAVDMALKRTRSFWNRKNFDITTPKDVDDFSDRRYKLGDQRVWHFRCPKCNALQIDKFEQIKGFNPTTGEACKFDESPGSKTPEGRWDYDGLAANLRYQCASCGHLIADTPAARRQISKSGEFVRMNPTAPRHRVSIHWGPLCAHWVSFRSRVEEFLNVLDALKKGDHLPMKTWVNETEGKSWEDSLGVIEDFDCLEQRKAEYNFGDAWPEEVCRFMAADKQAKGGEHYWYVIRAFARFGKSRLVTYGRCNSYLELETIRAEHNVLPLNALIDSGKWASEVYRFCVACGWKAWKGDDGPGYLAQIPNPKNPTQKITVRRIWQKSLVDPMLGQHKGVARARPIPLFRFSNDGAKDLLATFINGTRGEFTIPVSIARDYLKQMTAEKRMEKQDGRGRVSYFWKQVHVDNHIPDCELMILVAAVIRGFVQVQDQAEHPAQIPS